MAINLSVAKQFVTEWVATVPKINRVSRWSEFVQVLDWWTNGDDRAECTPTIEQFAQSINATPREAVQAANELRAMGIPLAEKENEGRYTGKKKPFPLVEFGRLLITSKNIDTTCQAFNLTRESFERKCAILIAYDIPLPPLVATSVPSWIVDMMRLRLHPAKYSPEEARTIRQKYKKGLPKRRQRGRKRVYKNDTGVYRPKKGMGMGRFNSYMGKARMSQREVAFLRSLH